nr:MAG TPA: hypothetical protein [Ackermannviridae sp.]
MHPAPKVQMFQQQKAKRNGKTLNQVSFNLYLAK